MMKKRLCVAVSLLFFFTTMAYAQFTLEPWAQEQQNHNRNGLASVTPNVSANPDVFTVNLGTDSLSNPIIASGLIYVGSKNDTLYIVNVDGSIHKKIANVGSHITPAYFGGYVVCARADTAYGVNTATWAVQWKLPLGGDVAVSRSVLIDINTGVGYVVTKNKVAAFDVFSGAVKFTTQGIFNRELISDPVMTNDGKVVVATKPSVSGGNAGTIYALNKNTGVKVWETTITSSFANSANIIKTLAVGGTSVHFLTQGNATSRAFRGALKASDGTFVWALSKYSKVETNTALAFSPDGATIYFASSTATYAGIVKYTANSGGTERLTSLTGVSSYSSVSVATNRLLYVGNDTGTLYTIDPLTLITSSRQLGTSPLGSPALASEFIAVSNTTGTLFIVASQNINKPPKVDSTIAAQTLFVNGVSFSKNLNNVFSDPDSNLLAFSAVSTDSSVAGATVVDSTLTVTPKAAGTTSITAFANDGNGGNTSTSFMVTVIDSANIPKPLLRLERVTAAPSGTVAVKLIVDADPLNGNFRFGQYIINFDSSKINNMAVVVGDSANGFNVDIIHSVITPIVPGTNKSLLAQMSSLTSVFGGLNQHVLTFLFNVTGSTGDSSVVAFDKRPTFTTMSSGNGKTFTGAALEFINGAVNILQNQYSVSGKVNFRGIPVSGEAVRLTYTNGFKQTATDGTGAYLFADIVTGPVSVKPMGTMTVPSSEINGADVLLIQKHVAKLITLSGIDSIAADTERNGSLDGLDVLNVQRYVAKLSNTGKVNEHIFVPDSSSFTLIADTVGVDFSLIHIGNIDFSGMPGGPLLLAKSNSVIQLSLGSITVNQDETAVIPLVVSCGQKNYAFVQSVLNYDSTKVQFQGVDIGAHANGFNVNIVHAYINPVVQGTNKTVLVQISSVTSSFTGVNQEVLKFNFSAVCAVGDSAVVAFDTRPTFTTISTNDGQTFTGSALSFKDGLIKVTDTATGISDREDTIIPTSFSLEQNYPNPFNPSTTIQYSVAQRSNIVIKVYDIRGREVATVVNASHMPGVYAITWDASQFASGMYLYRMQAGMFTQVRKMKLIK